jgi:hypothetical protein
MAASVIAAAARATRTSTTVNPRSFFLGIDLDGAFTLFGARA